MSLFVFMLSEKVSVKRCRDRGLYNKFYCLGMNEHVQLMAVLVKAI